MDSVIVASLIGGAATIAAGIGGVLISKSTRIERLFRQSNFPELVGSKWESTWTESHNSETITETEFIEFTHQRGQRVYGSITTASTPDMKWDLEGDYNDRFLRLFWHPSKDAPNKFFLDYGCYFFERQGNGTFEGYAVGFDHSSNKVEVSMHKLSKVS